MSILNRLDAPTPSAWRPEPGDSLIGRVVEIDSRTTEYGAYPMVTVQIDDGTEVCFHAFHSVAKSELARRRPGVGDKIGVKFLGKPAGKSYENYKIVVESAQPQAAVDWAKMGMEAAAEDTTADGWWPAEDAGSAFTEPTDDGEPPF